MAAAATDSASRCRRSRYGYDGRESSALIRRGPRTRPAATGGCCRSAPTGRRPRPAICAARETRVPPFKLDVLRIEDGQIAEITTFGPDLFDALGLPDTLEAR